MPLSSILGGAVLLAAGIGAATAGQALPNGHDTTTTAADGSSIHGQYVANLSSTSLSGRDVTQASRGSARPPVGSDKASVESLVNARHDKLATADDQAKDYSQTLASDLWVLPTSGFHITVWFGEAGGYWSSGYHTGIDFATAYGTPVVAVDNAVVAQAGWDGPYGNQIRLQFPNGDQVWYNHLSAIEVTVGQQVTKGEELGRVGETGNAYGYHLHFEYRLASDLHTAVDPKPFFDKHGIHLS